MTPLPTRKPGDPLPSADWNTLVSLVMAATRTGMGLAANIPAALSLDAYGDSITAGYAASSPGNNFVGLLGAALAVSPVNHGVSGSQAADQAPILYPSFTPYATGAQLVTLMIGTNDAWIYNINTYKQQAFAAFLGALIAWCATPNKLLGQSPGITYAGTWANSAKYGGAIAKETAAQNATATFSFFGSAAYVAYTVEDSNGATFSITIDGVVWRTGQVAGPGGASIATNLGAKFGSALFRIYGQTEGLHTVVITKTSALGTFTLDWVAPAGGQNYAGGCQVVVGGIPRSANLGSDAGLMPYNAIVKQTARQLARDGLPVAYADVPAFVVPATDIIADNTHPNDTGMGHIRDAFLTAISAQARPGTWREGATKQIPDALGDNVVRGGNVTLLPTAYGSVVAGGGDHSMNLSWNAITGGRSIVMEGFFNTGGGYNHFVGGTYGVAWGGMASDRSQVGVHAYASGNFLALGDAQTTDRVLRGQTLTATPLRLTSDAAAAGGANTVNLPNSGTYAVKLQVVARQIGGAAGTVGDTASFEVTALLKRGASPAATAVVGGYRVTSTPALVPLVAGSAMAPTLNDAGAANWRLTLAADTTNGGLAVTATGEASKSIQWAAHVLAIETVG